MPPHFWMHPVGLDTATCLDTPIYLDAHLYLGHPHMFALPQYVWMTPACLGAPYVWTPLSMVRCPHMFGTPPCLFGCPSYVWLSLYIHNTKKACFVRLRGCPYAPIHLDVPTCLDAPCMFGCHQLYGGIQTYGSLQTYRRHPNIGVPKLTGGYPNIWGIQTYRGCIQINGGIQHIGGVQTYGASKYMCHPTYRWASKHMGSYKCMGSIWTLPQSDKSCFL